MGIFENREENKIRKINEKYMKEAMAEEPGTQ